MLPQRFPFFDVNRKFMVFFFPLALSCTVGENNCVVCFDDKCGICESGFTADANGVCQGNLFVYKIIVSHPTITCITVLGYFPITRIGHIRAIDVYETCIFGYLHAV